MRQLLLLRHAKSSSDDPTISEHDHQLNARGRQTAKAMRGAIQGLDLAPQLALVSSSRRTRQTLDALEPWDGKALKPRVRPLDSLYLASADQLLAVLRAVDDETERLLVVGHNPGLHDVCLALLGGGTAAGADADRLALDFPTGALAEFALAGPWSALAPGGARLVRFVCPKDLPEMAG